MTTSKPTFDIDAAIQALREGHDLTGKDGILTPLIKQLTEAALQAELDSHLSQDSTPNRKNGRTAKTVKSPLGSFELHTPRDRAGTFEPQLVRKRQRRLDGFDDKVLALYARGLSTREIKAQLEELYGVDVSPTLISNVTDAVHPLCQDSCRLF